VNHVVEDDAIPLLVGGQRSIESLGSRQRRLAA
jgi:hypothetical protein